jgi:hypothetical protein
MKSRVRALKPQNLLCLAACLFLLVMGLGAAIAQDGKSSSAPRVVKFNFDQDTVGQTPAGFTSYAIGEGPAGKWVVQVMADAPSGKQVVVQTDADATDNRFPVLIADKEDYADVDVSVKGKAISGKVDQGIGLVFRFRDPQSYYVVRANALENNVRLYKMVNGRRKQIAGAEVKVTSDQWHTLRVVAQRDHIVCYFDGQKLIDVHDATYAQGKVGLWTKADSVTAFDDLTVANP